MKIAVTGADGLLGWHAAARLHAANCAARFRGQSVPYEMVLLGRREFDDVSQLAQALRGCDAVLHFAGVNRRPDEEMEDANPAISRKLAAAVEVSGANAHIVYANSTHSRGDTPYGRSKRNAASLLEANKGGFSDLILPHIFGECARSFYNNVTATLCQQLIVGEEPTVNPGAQVKLLHAGRAAQIAIDAAIARQSGTIEPEARPTAVQDLLDRLRMFHGSYLAGIFPDLSDDFDLTLFNSYRAALYPDGFPRPLKLNRDARGVLFEAVKGGGGGQTFMSWTEPGVTRGDHFHLAKVERFLVVSGEAVIRIRKVLGAGVWEYKVNGDEPAAVDMPTLHTHSIENTGSKPLLTLFWTHDLFDPSAPDTYADPVLKPSMLRSAAPRAAN